MQLFWSTSRMRCSAVHRRSSRLSTEGKASFLGRVAFTELSVSVGNYFLAATTMFFRSLPSAIFLFSSITKSQAHILPVIVTNHSVTLAAELVCCKSVSQNLWTEPAT
jgi:hypothetical protein